MNKSCQTSYAIQGLPFMGNPKHVVIHDLNRTLANYNQASFNIAKNDLRFRMITNQKLLNLSFFSPKNCHVCDIC